VWNKPSVILTWESSTSVLELIFRFSIVGGKKTAMACGKLSWMSSVLSENMS